MKFGFLLEDRQHLQNYDRSESTRLLIKKSLEAGHEPLIFFPDSILVDNGTVFAQMHEMEQFELKKTITISSPSQKNLNELDLINPALFPPLDLPVVYMLKLADTVMVNDPAEIIRFGEKITPLQQSSLMAWTLSGRDPADMMERMESSDHSKFILKPAHTYGGEGVELFDLEESDPMKRLKSYIDRIDATVIVQAKLPVRETGDKRILMLEDEILGWEKRIVKGEGVVANYSAGGDIVECELTKSERELVKQVRVHFKDYDLPLTGIDVIGTTITEVNITNPGGLCFVKEFHDLKPGETVIRYFEERVRLSQ